MADRLGGPAGDSRVDFYADPVPGPGPDVVHRRRCTGEPCSCFGLTVELRERPDTVLEVQLRDGAELVGSARLLDGGATLVLAGSAVFRASSTSNWGRHHRLVTEMLLRTAVRAADARTAALLVPPGWPAPLLALLRFAPYGAMMRREATR